MSGYALATGSADPVAAALADTTAEVRGYIAARAGEMVGEDGTLPSELTATALAIARWRLLTRLTVDDVEALKLLAPRAIDPALRARLHDVLWVLVKDVAAGRFFVSPPTTPAATQPRPVAGGAFGQFPGAGTTPGAPETFNF